MPFRNGVSYAYDFSDASPHDRGFDGEWAEIYHFEVYDETNRREGRGSRVLSWLCDQLRGEGVDRVYILIGGGDDTVDFLESHRFTITGRTDSGSVKAHKDL